MPMNQSGNSFIKSSVDLMDFTSVWTVAGLVAAAVVETGPGLGGLCQVAWLWWYNSSAWLLAFHLREDPGWQGQECLQHTSMNLPSGVEPQGSLAAKWWAHRVHHIEVYGIHYRWWVQYWCDPGQWTGQLGWSGLDRAIKIHRGVTHYFQLQCQPWRGVRLFHFCWHLQAAVWWCMLHCTMGHGHLLPLFLWDGCFLWYHSWSPQWTVHHVWVLP